MKTLALLAATVLLAFAPKARAADSYTCSLSGQMKGFGIAIGIGGEVIKGHGILACHNNTTGESENIPVKLSLIGGGSGIEFSHVRALDIRTAGIHVVNPGVFFRSYGIGATAGATLVKAGVDFNAAFRVNGNAKGEGFEVGIAGRDAVGLGAHLYAMTFKIKQD